ncbi:SpoIIE family protein phosphatase [Streptomyces sp. 900105755]
MTYSSVGHPTGTREERRHRQVPGPDHQPATGRPPSTRARTHAAASFRQGVLGFYTDGLIERRREDVDTGPARLAASSARHQADNPETLVGAVLTTYSRPATPLTAPPG